MKLTLLIQTMPINSDDDVEVEILVPVSTPELTRTPSPSFSVSSSSTYLPTPEELFQECNSAPPTPVFSPTAPASESGSQMKEKASPLDPARPLVGMQFETLEAAVHYVKEYERRRGYQWRKGESKRNKNDGKYSLTHSRFLIAFSR